MVIEIEIAMEIVLETRHSFSNYICILVIVVKPTIIVIIVMGMGNGKY